MAKGVPNHYPDEGEARVPALLSSFFRSADLELDTFRSGPGFLNPWETQRQRDLIDLALQLSNLWRLSREPLGQRHPNRAGAMVDRINEGRGDRIRSRVADLNKPRSEKPLRETVRSGDASEPGNELT